MFLSALLLALASSTDNFAVGLGVGLTKNKLLDWRLNLFISVCNAAGAWVAAVFGNALSSHQKGWISLLSAVAFFYLAYLELNEEAASAAGDAANKKDTASGAPKNESSITTTVSPFMALPMTLNNLVGGVAGGAAGITPLVGGSCALVASYVTMAVGYRIARRSSSKSSSSGTSVSKLSPPRVAAAIFAILGLLSLSDAAFGT